MTTITLLLSGAVSWVLRVALITIIPACRFPEGVRRVLDAAAPAVMAAMVATSLAHQGGAVALVTPSPLLGATLISGVVAWWTRRLGFTVGAGIGSLWILQMVF